MLTALGPVSHISRRCWQPGRINIGSAASVEAPMDPLCLWGTKWKQWGCLAAFDSGVLSSENMGQRRKSLLERGEAEPAIQRKSGAAILLHRGPELGPDRGWMPPFARCSPPPPCRARWKGIRGHIADTHCTEALYCWCCSIIRAISLLFIRDSCCFFIPSLSKWASSPWQLKAPLSGRFNESSCGENGQLGEFRRTQPLIFRLFDLCICQKEWTSFPVISFQFLSHLLLPLKN